MEAGYTLLQVREITGVNHGTLHKYENQRLNVPDAFWDKMLDFYETQLGTERVTEMLGMPKEDAMARPGNGCHPEILWMLEGLNATAMAKVREYVSELSEIPKYRKRYT